MLLMNATFYNSKCKERDSTRLFCLDVFRFFTDCLAVVSADSKKSRSFRF